MVFFSPFVCIRCYRFFSMVFSWNFHNNNVFHQYWTSWKVNFVNFDGLQQRSKIWLVTWFLSVRQTESRVHPCDDGQKRDRQEPSEHADHRRHVDHCYPSLAVLSDWFSSILAGNNATFQCHCKPLSWSPSKFSLMSCILDGSCDTLF